MLLMRKTRVQALRECGSAASTGAHARVSYIPSKRDHSFVFDARTGNNGQLTANALCIL